MAKRRNRREYLYVDAYNIINHWEHTRQKMTISLEEARVALLEALSEYSSYQNLYIIAVFDAYKVEGANTQDNYKGVEIVYTEENQTADQYIEKILNEYGKIRKITVATSDRLEQEMVLARGGTRISAAELEVDIFNARKTVKRSMDRMKLHSKRSFSKIDESLVDKLNEFRKKL